MPFYRYKSRDRLGRVLDAVVEYDSEEKLSANLEQMGLHVFAIEDVTEKSSKLAEFTDRFKVISRYDVIIVSRQLATMINAGVTLLDSLDGIAKQTQNRKLKAVMEDIIERVRTGSSFSQALGAHPSVFNEMYVNMVRVGEEGGILGTILERLSTLAIHESELKSKIKAAVTYPMIIISLTILIVVFLLIFVMPRFINIFESAGAELPLPTKILLGISYLLRNRWYIILVLLGAGVWTFLQSIKGERGRYRFDQIKLFLPVTGPLYLKILISRFTRLLSELSKSGIPLLYAIEVVGRTIDNKLLSQIITGTKKGVAAGQNLSDPLRLSGIFPPMVIQMISAGEKTGRLDDMLNEVSNFYDLEVEYGIRNLTAWIEPAMIVVMGLIVGFIALSVLLPIFNLVKLFK
ncbi:MAG: type II secretion system F family protein [Candidatus Omnitrophota bacterium]